MTRGVKSILIILLVIALIGGVIYGINTLNKPEGNNVRDEIVKEPSDTDTEENNVDENSSGDNEVKAEVVSIANDKINTQELTLLSKTEVDIDDDGELENVEMYTAAQRDEKGNMMWDDGQNWSLVVKDGDNEYHLFNEYVQLGELKYWVYTSGEKSEFHITTVMPTTAGLLMTDYVFDKDSKNFYKTIVFNAENINMLGSSH